MRLRDIPVGYAGREFTVPARVRTGADDLVLFLHGLGCAKEYFDGAFSVPELNDVALCAVDFPGHGSAVAPEGLPCTMELYSAVVRAIVDDLAARRVFVVAHSMGGAAGLLAIRGGCEITHVVSVEGNLVARDCDVASRGVAAMALEEFAGRGFAELTAKLSDSPHPAERSWARSLSRCDPAALHQAACSLVGWSDGGELLDLFTGLPSKSYLYGTEPNHVLPRLTGTGVHRIPDAGHFPMLDNPSGFYTILAGAIRHANRPTSSGGRDDRS